MIWARRILLGVLIVAFVLSFATMIHSSWLAYAVGSPEFLSDQLVKADVYTWVYDDLMPVALDEAEAGLTAESDNAGDSLVTDLPVPVGLVKEGLITVTETVLPPDRLQNIVEPVIAAVVPYLVGEKDTFLAEIELGESIDALAEGEIADASRQEIYDYLANELISGDIIEDSVTEAGLPTGITVTWEEISSAIAEALRDGWGRETLAQIINGLAAYLKGETDDLDIAVDLTKDEATVVSALADLGDRKVQDYFNALPEGSQQEFDEALENLAPGSLPDSRPPDMDYQEFKAALDIDIAALVQEWVGDRIPDSWTYTDDQFRESLGPGITQFLDKTRDFIAEVDELTEEDLQQSVADALDTDVETLEDARQTIDTVIETRDEIATFRTWVWVFWLIPAVLLLLIALLGGRTWRGRLLWALAVLFITSLMIFVAVLAYKAFLIDDHAQRLLGDPNAQEGVKAVVTEKGNEVVHTTFSSLAAGIQSTVLYVMLGSGVLLLGIWGWTFWQSRRRSQPGQ
jgi:hypothetical protein